MKNSMRVNYVCRICLVECAGKKTKTMQPLFDNSERCKDIVQKIEECGGIVLKHHDGFPTMLCLQCLDQLNTSYKFRTMCQASESALFDAIVKPEPQSQLDNDTAGSGQSVDDENEMFFELHSEEFIDGEEVDISELNAQNIMPADEEESEKITKIENDNDDDIECLEELFDPSDEEYKPEDESRRKTVATRKTRKKVGRPRTKRKRGRPSTVQSASPAKRGRIKIVKDQLKGDATQSSTMCEICGNIYSKQSLLNMHMRRHLSEKPFECEICGKTFACPSEITRHMRVHTGEKPYVCKYCGRTFSDRSTNIKHERIHTNTRPFQCTTCGKSFTYSNVLKNHMLTHTGEKPFNCVPCNKTFSRKHQLDQHCTTLTHQQTVKNLDAVAAELIGESESLAQQILNSSITDTVE